MYWDLHPLLGDTITSLISGTLPEYFRYHSEVINRDWTILLSLFSGGKNGSELDTSSPWPVDWGYVLTVPDSFSCQHKSYAILYEHLSNMWLSSLEIGAAQLRSVTEIAPKTPFLCVNRSPIWYGFRAGTKAIRYSVYLACVLSLYVSTATQYQMWCDLHATGCF